MVADPGWQTRTVLFAQDDLPSDVLPSPDTFTGWALGALILLAGLLVLHKILSVTARLLLDDEGVAKKLLLATRAPIRVIVVGSGLLFWINQSNLEPDTESSLRHGSQIVLIAGFGFLFIRIVGFATDSVVSRLPLSDADNLRSRRAQTQVTVLRRVGNVAIGVLTAGIILWTFPSVRALGTSILASAGLIGILAGVAARSTFGNLIAGLQIAFAEPIRLDDVVVVEGEYGTIEEITLTYVVMRSWDKRRIVLPTLWFIENRFENWTKTSSDLTGTVMIHLDLDADVDAFRAEALRFIATRIEWDGEVAAVHVVDATPTSKQVRVTASAIDSSRTFELRAAVREHLLHWVSESRPQDLARLRSEIEDRRMGN